MKEVVITLLVAVLILFIFKGNYNKYEPIIVTHTDTLVKHDTLRKFKKGDSIPFVVLDTIYQIDQVHDTAYIVNDYNKIKVYTDTLRINTDNSVYIKDTITQNRILGRSFLANLSQKTITITNDIYHKPKNELFIGFVGDYQRYDQKIGIGLGLNYKKQNESYIINYTTNQISVGIYKKLF